MITLVNQDNTPVQVDEGESHDLLVTLYDAQDPPQVIDPATADTIQLTLYDRATDTAINGRLDQDVKGANGGTVEGQQVRIRLDADDSVIVATDAMPQTLEDHIARLEFTYDDGQGPGNERTGKSEYVFKVRKLPAVSLPT